MSTEIRVKCTSCKKVMAASSLQIEEAREVGCYFSTCCSAVATVDRVSIKTPRHKRLRCGQDVGFGMQCRRERGHDGFHTWDPKRLLGETPI